MCLASTVQTRDQAPAARPDLGVACTECSSAHGAGPAGCGGGGGARLSSPAVAGSLDISGVDLSAIRASAMSADAGAFPPEREQSFGGGGDLLNV